MIHTLIQTACGALPLLVLLCGATSTAQVAGDSSRSSPRADPPPGFTVDVDAALRLAADQGRDLLLYFSGSDWSRECRKLRDDVFEKDGFASIDAGDLVLLQVDFPRDPAAQSDAVKEACRGLQERYRTNRFPSVFLADADGRAYASIDELAFLGPRSFLAAVAEARAIRARRDDAWSRSTEDSSPAERSAALAAGLRTIDPGLWRHYRPELEQVLAVDGAGTDESLADFRRTQLGLEAEDEVPALMEKVQKLFGQGRLGDAVERIDTFLAEREAVLSAGARQSLLYSKAGLCSRVADFDGAVGALDAALAIDPRSALAEQMKVLRAQLAAMRKR